MRLFLFALLGFPISLFCQNSDTADVFDLYPWLAETYLNCEELRFEEYNNGAFAYIYASDGVLYFQDGTFYCADGLDRDCRSLYGLTPDDISLEFSCQADPSGDMMDSAQAIELYIDSTSVEIGDEFCVDLHTSAIEDLLSFQFQIELSNTNLQVIEANSELVADAFTLIEDTTIKFIWFSEDLMPIDIVQGSTLVTICFSVVDDVDLMTQLNLLNTDRLFAQFITATATGDFFENVDISLSGGQVDIDSSSSNTDDQAVIEGLPIDQYPWMTDAIEGLACPGTLVTEYDFGSYRFFYFSASNSRILYFQDGTFYCEDSATRDCKAFYQLLPDKITNQWSCEN